MIPGGPKLSLADTQGRLSMADGKKRAWIKGAINPEHRGAFKKKAVAAGETTARYARQHAADKGTTGEQARLAETLLGMSRKAKASRRYPHGSNAKAEG